LLTATKIEKKKKKLRLMLSFIFDTMIAAIAPDRDTTERQDHNGVPVSKFNEKIIGKIGKDVVRNDERDKG
jgi:hypothetical protein